MVVNKLCDVVYCMYVDFGFKVVVDVMNGGNFKFLMVIIGID